MRPVVAADLGGKEHGITKLLHIARVPPQKSPRSVLPSE